MPKLCKNCNKQFDNEVDFCPYCGSRTVELKEKHKKPSCLKCGAPLEGDEDFCPNCGAKIFQHKQPTNPTKPIIKSEVKSPSDSVENSKVFKQRRMGRAPYLIFSVVWIIVVIFMSMYKSDRMAHGYVSLGFIPASIFCGLWILSFTLTVRRCHDFNASGLLAIFAIIPFFNLIIGLIPGTHGDNKYGPES